MGELERAAVAGTLRAEVMMLPTAYGREQPTIRVRFLGESFVIAQSKKHRWLASAVYMLAAAAELESIGQSWCVISDANAGTVVLELVRGDAAESEAGLTALRAAVAVAAIEGVRCA